MTNEQILEKAINKAIKNGFKNDGLIIWCNSLFNDLEDYVAYNQLLFNHDFAKAFWANEKDPRTNNVIWGWQYHLQEMVLEKEPLKYIERFL